MDLHHVQRAIFDGWPTGIHGDLGRYTELAFKPWDGTFRKKRIISLKRVDNLLTQLASLQRFSDPSIRQQRDWHVSTDVEFKYVLRQLESWEAKWFVRLILRQYVTIALDEDYVLQQYHFLLPGLLKFQDDFDAAFAMLRGKLVFCPSAPGPALEESWRLKAAKLLKPVIGVKVARPHFHKAWSFKNCIQLTKNLAWAAEVKYDGEYCEIHINLRNTSNNIKIFSKNGKDATSDRQCLHDTIRTALRIGQPDCLLKQNCIILAEMVAYSDKEEKILPFSKIRKHISRSGSFLGTLQDSLPHEWEHLMLVFFDILMLDDDPVLRNCLQDRRRVLRDLVQTIPGRSQRSEWTYLNFKSDHGVIDLKQAFARSLAYRQEGLVLKPLGTPYFPLNVDTRSFQPGYFIKLKRDYLGDMGGQRDLGDFAIIGACFDPHMAMKTDLKPFHWTHFHLGCATNKTAALISGVKPHFKVVACIPFEKCIPNSELKHLNTFGPFQKVDLRNDDLIDTFSFKHSKSFSHRMTVAFKKPFVAEILGSGYEKVQNETFEMLRHPRIKKIHHDRTWEDAVSMDELGRMAEETWDIPQASELDGHARDVAILVERYVKEKQVPQTTTSEYETTQETATTELADSSISSDAVVQETLQTASSNACTTLSTSQYLGSTQETGIRASKEIRILISEDSSERSTIVNSSHRIKENPFPTPHSPPSRLPSSKKHIDLKDALSPPPSKRRKRLRKPLGDTGNKNLGSFDYDSQKKVIHIYTDQGWQVHVHNEPPSTENQKSSGFL